MKAFKALVEKTKVIQAEIEPIKEIPVTQPKVTMTATKKKALAVLQPASAAVLRRAAQLGQVPGLHCGVCMIGTDCPEFEEDRGFCTLEGPGRVFSTTDTRDKEDILATMHEVAGDMVTRYRRAKFQEIHAHGGMVDASVTRLGKEAVEMMNHLLVLDQEQETLTLQTEGSPDDMAAQLRAMFSAPAEAESEVEINPAMPELPAPNPTVEPPPFVEHPADGSAFVLVDE